MKSRLLPRLRRDMGRNWGLYLLALPMVLFYLIFCYGPIYGQIIAFKDFSPGLGIWGSPWVGFQHFVDFFNSRTCWELIRNTLMINLYGLVFGLPAPIIFALLLNEVKNSAFKRTIQTVSYLPYFISLVVACGMILEFTRQDGVVNDLIALFGETGFLYAGPRLVLADLHHHGYLAGPGLGQHHLHCRHYQH